MKIRLQKYLADAGVGSRRACEEIILAGRVSVDGQAATLGSSVEADGASVTVDGKLVSAQPKEYWLFNKPTGVLSAVVDSRGRPTVTDRVPARVRVYPVGRLDLDSSGLLLLTNDGALTERLLHPRYHVEKEYVVMVRGTIEEKALDKLRGGVVLEEGLTSPARVTLLSRPSGARDGLSVMKVVIHEGRKRQVRRMFSAVGKTVESLHRSRFAILTDAGLALGEARRLTDTEIEALREMAGLV